DGEDRLMRTPYARTRDRGSATIVVLWSIAIASVIVAATQMVTWRTTVLGRAALGRVQARWAARAGMERVIATLASHTQTPDTEDPMSLVRDLELDWEGTLESGTWDIRHVAEGEEFRGPLDLHSRININLITKSQLLELPEMNIDTTDAVLDWKDEDDEVQGIGAERSFYEGRDLGYVPRNAPFKSITELELVAGAWPESIRGEDWNLNNRLDSNEDDGESSAPDDDFDGRMDSGWAGYLTARSVDSPLGRSGYPKINLADTLLGHLVDIVGVDEAQAEALMTYGATPNAIMGSLLAIDLAELVGAPAASDTSSRRTTGRSSGGSNNSTETPVAALSPEQLRAIFAECTTTSYEGPEVVSGKVNLNTAGPEVLRIIFAGDSAIAESIMAYRQSRAEGITSIVDLLELRRIDPNVLATVADQLDVTGWVYSISSRGKSSSGQEVEIHAVVDRSTLPVKIIEYRED
ncbi:MAG: type II secretion system protein GspK, partial [Planctomycetota bacterium]|nr:type II secretion system protein GspK [Planctomycetota bacterium]